MGIVLIVPMKTTDNYPERFLLYSPSRSENDLYQLVVSLKKTVPFKSSPSHHDQNSLTKTVITAMLGMMQLLTTFLRATCTRKSLLCPTFDIRDKSVKSFWLMPIIAEAKIVNLK